MALRLTDDADGRRGKPSFDDERYAWKPFGCCRLGLRSSFVDVYTDAAATAAAAAVAPVATATVVTTHAAAAPANDTGTGARFSTEPWFDNAERTALSVTLQLHLQLEPTDGGV